MDPTYSFRSLLGLDTPVLVSLELYYSSFSVTGSHLYQPMVHVLFSQHSTLDTHSKTVSGGTLSSAIAGDP